MLSLRNKNSKFRSANSVSYTKQIEPKVLTENLQIYTVILVQTNHIFGCMIIDYYCKRLYVKFKK